MVAYYHVLHDDGRRCRRCGRRSQLFGDRDVTTGWTGWCGVCSAQWNSWFQLRSCRRCSRTCSVKSPVFTAFGLGRHVALLVDSFVFADSFLVEANVLYRHRRSLAILEWTCARINWWLADDSSEELDLNEEEIEQPGLATLRKAWMDGGENLLQYIFSFLHQPSSVALFWNARAEPCWEMYQWNDRYWLWKSDTGEWFYYDAPPLHWRRYCWFCSIPLQPSNLVCWWYDADRHRWFAEPSYKSVRVEVYAALQQ